MSAFSGVMAALSATWSLLAVVASAQDRPVAMVYAVVAVAFALLANAGRETG